MSLEKLGRHPESQGLPGASESNVVNIVILLRLEGMSRSCLRALTCCPTAWSTFIDIWCRMSMGRGYESMVKNETERRRVGNCSQDGSSSHGRLSFRAVRTDSSD